MPEEKNKNDALKFAMKLIGLRRRSETEIRQRLKDKGFDKPLIEETVEELYRFKYLNDEAFAESYINDRINFRPAGKFVIRNELKKRGVSEKIIEEKLEELLSDEKELEMAGNLLQKKIRIIHSKDPQKIRGKVLYFLKSRGFSQNTISQAMQNELELDKPINFEDY
ncbi:MAG: regulatory protein RecX [Candidatus Pacebacteria bacterium]|nr:regulatory protein RecX [Candidatus Paceibacterota bacterium]